MGPIYTLRNAYGAQAKKKATNLRESKVEYLGGIAGRKEKRKMIRF